MQDTKQYVHVMYKYLRLLVTQPSKMQDAKQYVHVMYMYLPHGHPALK